MRVLIKTNDAVRHFKNASRLAEEIGITPQAINQWGDYVPDPSVGKIMALVPNIPYEIVRNKSESALTT
ncbi:Cro/Cl family transcriptional regulator [Acinetobacter radioresistens]|uniref:Cro/CI family transcriptional regulator n=1 Tax=Acinetobacter radioresistens TaxID=40216 RepID=UPI0021D0772A|nr:Cro/CI family transcriptional regulator [Acinetobacter radioresistens]MCU4621831.1 Cro/Cl family transcriptional regulator [Acinetobacter radioresistens]